MSNRRRTLKPSRNQLQFELEYLPAAPDLPPIKHNGSGTEPAAQHEFGRAKLMICILLLGQVAASIDAIGKALRTVTDFAMWMKHLVESIACNVEACDFLDCCIVVAKWFSG